MCAGVSTSLLRQPCFVPETKKVDVLLQEFQETRNHMVIVLDEYGGVSGLVSMEDVLDEINERLALELPDDGDFDTIGGFVFTQLGHVPTVEEELVWHNVRITVLEATRRRIERVRVEVLDRPKRETG